MTDEVSFSYPRAPTDILSDEPGGSLNLDRADGAELGVGDASRQFKTMAAINRCRDLSD